MSLNTADKKWIVEVVSEIVTKAVTKSVKDSETRLKSYIDEKIEVVTKRIDTLVLKNDLKE